MNKAAIWCLLALLVVGIIAAVAVVVILKFTGNKDISGGDVNQKTMYYAMYLGDGAPRSRLPFMSPQYRSKCSLQMNVDNTRDSILAMKDLKQKYGFILFTDRVEITSAMRSDEALSKLSKIEPKSPGSVFKQESVMEEFIKHRRGKDLLVYYIPCDYNYRENDEDLEEFIEEMKEAGVSRKTLIVSNTQPAKTVSRMYGVGEGNALGYDSEDRADRIADFGRSFEEVTTSKQPEVVTTEATTEASRKTAPPSSTSPANETAAPSSTPSTGRVETTVPIRRTTTFATSTRRTPGSSPTQSTKSIETTMPIRTSTTTATKAQTSTTSSRKTTMDPVSTRSTSEPTTTSTREPDTQSTTTRIVTTETSSSTTFETSTSTDRPRPPTTAPPPKKNLHCLLVGDLYNFGENVSAYIQEVDFIAEVSHDLFKTRDLASMGLWLYGYTEKFNSLDESLDNMRSSYQHFIDDLYEVEFNTAVEKPLSTAEAIKTLNNIVDTKNRVNCLIFFSAQENTSGLPRLDPDQNKSKINTIVGVGFSDTNLHNVVAPRGVAVSVPHSYSEQDIERVVAAVLGRPDVGSTTLPTSSDTTTSSSLETSTVTSDKHTTTEPEPESEELHCLFVYDLFNFGNNVDAYDTEQQFVADIGEDFYDSSTMSSTVGLWAYGHTLTTTSPDAALNFMMDEYDDFMDKLVELEYEEIDEPLSTADAIERINETYDNKRRANCIVFFSAQQDTKTLPQLNPQNMHLKRIVAVGFNGTDLTKVVPPGGVAVSVKYDYADEDVENVMDAIFGRKVVSTTTTSKPTQKPSTSIRPTETTTEMYGTSTSATATATEEPMTTPTNEVVTRETTVATPSTTLTPGVTTITTIELTTTESTPEVTSPTNTKPLTTESTPGITSPTTTKPPTTESTPELPATTTTELPTTESTPEVTSTTTTKPPTTESTPEVTSTTTTKPPTTESTPEVPATTTTELPTTESTLEVTSTTTTKPPTTESTPEVTSTTTTKPPTTESTPEVPATTTIKLTTTESTPEVLSTSEATISETTRTSAEGTSTTQAPHPKKNIHCLLVGDLYNFGDNVTAYTQEVDFIAEISYDLFQNQDISSMGLWLYGNTRKFASLEGSLNNMRSSYQLFINDLYDVEYNLIEKPLSTGKAIETLNNLVDDRNLVNCLIFFSAQENTLKLPRLDPDQTKSKINTIVGVGFSGTNLHNVVSPRGVAVSVPYSYSEHDIEQVVAAVLRGIPTTSSATQEPTTTQTKEVTTGEITETTPLTTSTPEVTTTTSTELPTTESTREVTSTTTIELTTTESTPEVAATTTTELPSTESTLEVTSTTTTELPSTTSTAEATITSTAQTSEITTTETVLSSSEGTITTQGTILASADQAQIGALHVAGLSNRAIVAQLDPSHEYVNRRIRRFKSSSTLSIAQMRAHLDLNVSRMTIWRSVQGNTNIAREVKWETSRLTSQHKVACLV
ncbi:hypothetical protein Y032_0193g1400 [Ancylostoma ceylanicum]|uniref:Uncharacterized protein n=1 Tax=Ancylostoma ceylanicum TaxID=53326 RepID=A0A016SP98_9BILA|nr:hypothetical protein Y032_0193g1400 [Ancylostoma ceylanicum]